jgi:hypothetical protein
MRTIKIEQISFRADMPIRDEAYAIVTDGQRYAFAWGPTYPFADEVPAQDVKDGESGIEWFETEEAARAAMNHAAEAWEMTRGK